jgi:hypothetical protein
MLARPKPLLKTGHKKREKEREDKDPQGQSPKEQVKRVYREQVSTYYKKEKCQFYVLKARI